MGNAQRSTPIETPWFSRAYRGDFENVCVVGVLAGTSLFHAPRLDRFGSDLPILLAMDDDDTN